MLLSHLTKAKIHTKFTVEKKMATAKETALALTNLPLDNKSKALKLALKHLGLLELAGRKIKAGREEGKGKGVRSAGEKIPNPTSKLKKSEGQHSYAFGVCFGKHHSL